MGHASRTVSCTQVVLGVPPIYHWDTGTRLSQPSRGTHLGHVGTHKEMKAEKWELTIEALPKKPGWPVAKYRLRSLLKSMLRTFGFKAIEVRPKP